MINLGNLGGTLFYQDYPLLKFKYVDDILQNAMLLSNRYLPLEFEDFIIDDMRLRLFFQARIVPRTRHRIDEDLAESPIGYYHPERIIRYQNGTTFADPYYLVCDGDKTCWKD